MKEKEYKAISPLTQTRYTGLLCYTKSCLLVHTQMIDQIFPDNGNHLSLQQTREYRSPWVDRDMYQGPMYLFMTQNNLLKVHINKHNGRSILIFLGTSTSLISHK